MSVHASDEIRVFEADVIASSAMVGAFWHRCPEAAFYYVTTRGELDPSGIGKCRRCGERLPTKVRYPRVGSA